MSRFKTWSEEQEDCEDIELGEDIEEHYANNPESFEPYEAYRKRRLLDADHEFYAGEVSNG